MKIISRTSVTIRFKQPYIDWAKSLPDAEAEGGALPDPTSEHTVFLIPQYDFPEDSAGYIDRHFKQIFQQQLWEWCIDEDRWPKKLTLEMFHEWFDIEINSIVIDMVKGEIGKEEYYQ